ncbi:MAG: hypothetical protein ACRC14_07045 [Paracoccaceae bacterium]
MSRKPLALLAFLLASALPLSALAGTPPTRFLPEQAPELRSLAQAVPDGFSVEQARQVALVILDDASRRTDGSIAQVQADQVRVTGLAGVAGDDPEILAIHANLLGIEAGLEPDLVRVLTLAKAGTRALDQLVRDNPDNGGVLLQRALGALHAPPVAGRIGIAVTDFRSLVDGDFGLSAPAHAEIQVLLAQSLIKAGQKTEAEAVLQAVAAGDVAEWATAAQALLSDL